MSEVGTERLVKMAWSARRATVREKDLDQLRLIVSIEDYKSLLRCADHRSPSIYLDQRDRLRVCGLQVVVVPSTPTVMTAKELQ